MNGQIHVVNSTESLFNAVKRANESDVIVVEPGHYNIYHLTISKSLVIRALDAKNRPVFHGIGSKPMFHMNARCLIIQSIETMATDAACFNVYGDGSLVLYSCHICMFITIFQNSVVPISCTSTT